MLILDFAKNVIDTGINFYDKYRKDKLEIEKTVLKVLKEERRIKGINLIQNELNQLLKKLEELRDEYNDDGENSK